MAVLRVNPTRMVLSGLKKRLAAATRGHKLLKDKRDDLMKRFLELVRENMELRLQMEDKLVGAYARLAAAGASLGDDVVQEALMLPRQRVFADVKSCSIMGIEVPEFRAAGMDGGSGVRYPYGFAFTSGELDESVDGLAEVVPLMLKLAQAEKTVQRMAEEIEKTRRRVNALEYVQIPALRETIRRISMKLDENERSNLARLMKVKDMMIARQHEGG